MISDVDKVSQKTGGERKKKRFHNPMPRRQISKWSTTENPQQTREAMRVMRVMFVWLLVLMLVVVVAVKYTTRTTEPFETPQKQRECPQMPDMTKYIRIDEIPCWNCNLTPTIH